MIRNFRTPLSPGFHAQSGETKSHLHEVYTTIPPLFGWKRIHVGSPMKDAVNAWAETARLAALAPGALEQPPASSGKTSTTEDHRMTKDEVLFAFHRYVNNPKPIDVTWWVQVFPQFADDIRAHAVEMIDMKTRAAAHDDELFRLATDG